MKKRNDLEDKKVAEPIGFQMGTSKKGNSAYLTIFPDGMTKMKVGEEEVMVKSCDLKAFLFVTDKEQQRYLVPKKTTMHTELCEIAFLAPHDCRKGDKVKVVKEVPKFITQQI